MSEKKPELDGDHQELTRGQPGFRNRPERTGFDPFDSSAEEGHMIGVFLRNLLTLKLRTRNLLYLLMMAVFGLLPLVLMIFWILGDLGSGNFKLYLCVPGFFIVVTGYLTANLLLCIKEIIQQPLDSRSSREKKPEKKQPKRRKDFH